MQLLKITSKGSLHFRMSDGRTGVSYNTGYIRVSVKGQNWRLYQINQVKKVVRSKKSGDYHYDRVLIPNQSDRLNALLEFDSNNCVHG